MPKKGLSVSQRKGILLQKAKKGGWTLCVGAGVSRGAFPDWKTLVERLAPEDGDPATSKSTISRLAETFSLDSLIQAAQNRLGLDAENFAKLLSTKLFEDIHNKLGQDWGLAAKALCALTPADLTPHQWNQFIKLIENNYPHLSSLAIAKVISKSFGSEAAPSSIISFNAETLLYALVTGYVGKNGSYTPGRLDHQKKTMDRITRSLSNRYSNRIPYFHCHGILPVPGGTSKFERDNGIDKLVFSESEYLNLSNDSFSWQSSVFLRACLFNSIVFLGVSLADPNMRRWLSWVHQNKLNELRLLGVNSDSTSHYWINLEPRDKATKEWIESCVSHLGVRLVWISDWNETEACLNEMAGLQ